MTSKNLTCTATISKEGVEFIEFHYGGGTKNEFFLEHFEVLSNNLLLRGLRGPFDFPRLS